MSTTTPILDTFNRANEGPPPSASWSFPTRQGKDGLKVVSNQAGGNAAADDNYSWWNVTTFGPDCEVYVTVPTLPVSGDYIWVDARIASPNSASTDLYEFTWNGTNFEFYRMDNDVFTQLGVSIAGTFSAGDTLLLRIIGSTLSGYKISGGVETLIGTRTDSTYTAAGFIGAGGFSSTFRMDNFGGGTIPPIAQFVTPRMQRRATVVDSWRP